MFVSLLAQIAVAVVACLHVVAFVLEAFLWSTPRGRRIFGLTPESAAASKVLAFNQGFYNLFLAAGLAWGLLGGPCAFGIKVFFLSCVVVAGLVGGITAKRSILFFQALPGAFALLLVYFSQR